MPKRQGKMLRLSGEIIGALMGKFRTVNNLMLR
jgi:hypothetical protein